MTQDRVRSLASVGIALLGLALAFAAPAPVSAQPVPIPPTWGGDFLSRARLTGDWGGFRDEMGKKGVVLDVDLLATPQGVASGGRNTGIEFWANAEYTLNVDTGKAGLWPGGFLRVIGLTGFGDNVLKDSGAFSPVNSGAIVPKPDENTSGLMQATFMQFLSPKFGVVAGKFDVLDSMQGEFTGNYRTQFQNLGIAIPAAAALFPLSAYGGGVVVLPFEGLALSALVIDPGGTVTNSDVTEAFDNGVMVVAGGKLDVKPFGLVGHQNLIGMWSNKERLSIDQDPRNIGRFLLEERFPRLGDPGPILRRILERFFPGLLVPGQPARKENDTWAVIYGFDQYLWQPGGDPHRGIGVFFNFGATDGDANPVKYSYSLGIGGNGVVPGRPRDTFGIGWARTELSDNFVPFLRQRLKLGLQREDAIEMYYNAALTPWLGATVDLQVIEPAITKMLDASGNRLTSMDTSLVLGGRFYLRF